MILGYDNQALRDDTLFLVRLHCVLVCNFYWNIDTNSVPVHAEHAIRLAVGWTEAFRDPRARHVLQQVRGPSHALCAIQSNVGCSVQASSIPMGSVDCTDPKAIDPLTLKLGIQSQSFPILFKVPQRIIYTFRLG